MDEECAMQLTAEGILKGALTWQRRALLMPHMRMEQNGRFFVKKCDVFREFCYLRANPLFFFVGTMYNGFIVEEFSQTKQADKAGDE